MRFLINYQEAKHRADSNGEETTQIRIRKKSPKQRQEIGGGGPEEEQILAFGHTHSIVFHQIQNHIGRKPIT